MVLDAMSLGEIVKEVNIERKRQEDHSTSSHSSVKNYWRGAALLAQWLKIRLPMQGTGVRALVWEDPTCHGATKHVRHNY